MKKFINILKHNTLFGIIIGAIIMGGVNVMAIDYLYNANQVSYTPSDDTSEIKDVKSALDELYSQSSGAPELELAGNFWNWDTYIDFTPTDVYSEYIVTVSHDSGGKQANSTMSAECLINAITNATYETLYSASSGYHVHRVFKIVPDGSGNAIHITFSGGSYYKSLIGIKK